MLVDQIDVGSNVIDIGCGTGSLVFDLAEKCKSVTGVELSSKMIAHAQHRLGLSKKQNVIFLRGDGTNLAHFQNQEFDYATISMVIHEIPLELQTKVLSEAKRIAKQVVVADWVTPLPVSFSGIRMRLIEFLAGPKHFKGFRNFQKNNGINQLLKSSQLSVVKESINRNGTIRVVNLA